MKKDNTPGLEGYYISRLGTLWSRYHKSGKLTHSEWHKVKPNHNQKGYLFVQKKGKCWYLHRLVALAWIPNPENKPYVCHKDNNPLNNHYKNLYWGTPKENAQQCIRDGRFHFNSGWNAFSDRKKYRIYRFMLRHPDYTANEIAKKFSTGRCMVFKIKKKYGS